MDRLPVTPITDDAVPAVLALNRAFEAETAPLSAAELAAFRAMAAFTGCVDQGAAGFVTAMDQDADYDGTNFSWFRARYARFIYVDRIIVSPTAQGTGCGRALYEALFDAARDMGHPMIACEINVAPPNPQSVAFHAKLGFVQVGEAEILDGAKTVGYFVKDLKG